jgi:acetyltransferase EpsM
MKKIIIIGGHGNGTVVQSTIEDINSISKEWDILGFLNDRDKGPINGLPVLGPVEKSTVDKFIKDPNIYFFYSILSLKNNFKTLDKLHVLQIPTNRFATIIHPTAVVSKFSEIGYGVCVQPFVSVGPNTKIGNHVQIYAQSLVGHGAILDNYTYIANNACIGAAVHLLEGAYLGTNATTLEHVTLGRWSVVGIGSVVLRNVGDYEKVAGNPARLIGYTK